MARQPRLKIAEGVYHVTQRGVEKRGIVVDDEDRRLCEERRNVVFHNLVSRVP